MGVMSQFEILFNLPEILRMDTNSLTGEDFEFLLTPGDIEIGIEEFDQLMTPYSMKWNKIFRDNWYYYQVDNDEFTYSFELPGIQMTFNKEISYKKAKTIAEEVAKNLTEYSGIEVIVNFIPTDKIIRLN